MGVRRTGWRWRASAVGLLALGLLAPTLATQGAQAAPVEVPSIVELVDGASPDAVADAARIDPSATFDHALDGFAADLTSAEAARLRSDPLVRRIVPVAGGQLLARPERASALPQADPALLGLDVAVARVFQLAQEVLNGLGLGRPAQVVPTALQRIGLPASATAKVDHVGDPMDVTIAFVDSGISPLTDLELDGGFDCIGTGDWDHDDYDDGEGHGTLVASLAAARDDAKGIVGVAPGARVLSAKAVDHNGYGTTTSILCALDWAMDPAQDVDVINISLGWVAKRFGAKPGACVPNDPQPDVIHEAICEAVAAGITVVVAAGNEGRDIAALEPGAYPAAYPEVITVSGLADFDGKAGAAAPAIGCGAGQQDDHFWTRSNWGLGVDLAAVSSCVQTNAADGTLVTTSGTSLAAPAVSGAAALIIAASDERLTPAQVRDRLLAAAQLEPIPGDPDALPEGVLDVSGF